LRESIEAPEAFFTDDRDFVLRAFIFVQHRDPAPANQKAPFASDAVVKPRRPAKQFAVTLRSDYEIVPEASRLLVPRFLAFAPEVHDTTLGANTVPWRNPSQSREIEKKSADRA